jgi:hypothetical protein
MNANDPEVNRQTTNPDELSRLLEIELIQKRAEWQQASARHKNLRSVSFLFLFVVVMAALVGFYFIFMRVNENRQHRPVNDPTESATP